MIKDIKNNIKAIKYVLICCKLYPLWSILYIIGNVLNAIVKVSMVADIIDMATLALDDENPMSHFEGICNKIIIYLIIFAVLAAYRSFYSMYIHNR